MPSISICCHTISDPDVGGMSVEVHSLLIFFIMTALFEMILNYHSLKIKSYKLTENRFLVSKATVH